MHEIFVIINTNPRNHSNTTDGDGGGGREQHRKNTHTNELVPDNPQLLYDDANHYKTDE